MSWDLPPHTIRLVPLGGLGEIGMNCLALEQEDGIVVVDCGTSFPHDDHGVDLIHPDFTWLRERAERLRGVFLTHGHEDHIGALPFLLSELDVPVWGPPHALGLVRRRLEEHDFDLHEVELITALPGRHYAVGGFDIEPVRVAHSIVEATALRIRTRAGTIVHSGDFNFDADPPDGEPTDEARLRAIGDARVELLLSDSTNADIAVRPGSERSVAAALEALVNCAPARVFIAMFASNVQRLMMIGEIARRTDRKLCLLGRSLLTHVEVALEIGRLRWPSDLRISGDDARSWPRERLLVLAGGTQAEQSSALRRLASGTHQLLEVEQGDTVILSSRTIPGNERPVREMTDDLLRRGAVVHTRSSAPELHTSGHAGRSEQQRMIDLVRPRAFVPIHGTLHHLRRHAELATSRGICDALVAENGTALTFDADGLKLEGPVPHGKVAIAYGGEPLPIEALTRRVELGRRGVVLVSLLVDQQSRLIAGPEISSRGVPRVDDDPAAQRSVAREVAGALERVRYERGLDIADELRRAARRKLSDIAGFRPVVEVHLLRRV